MLTVVAALICASAAATASQAAPGTDSTRGRAPVAAAGAAAAATADLPSPPSGPATDRRVAAASLAPHLRLLGRVAPAATGGALVMAWPLTAVGLRFEGSGVAAWLADTGVHHVDGRRSRNTYAVEVDGAVTRVVTAASTTAQRVVLASDLAPGPHTVWLTKRTEAMVGTGALDSIELAADARLLPPPPPRARRIVAYGASVEAGFGILCAVTREHMSGFTSETEDATRTYPALLGRAFAADVVAIAFSGKGILNPRDGTHSLPELAWRLEPDRTPLWDTASDAAADVVLVALGPNDFRPHVPNRRRFIAAYAAFLATLRERHPTAAILSVITPMIEGEDREQLEQLIGKAVARRRDPRISRLEFPHYPGPDYGCDFHPNLALHRRLASVAAPVVAAAAGWPVPTEAALDAAAAAATATGS